MPEAYQRLLMSVEDSEGADVAEERMIMLADASVDIATALPVVLKSLGDMGVLISVMGAIKAAYLLGVRDGKAKGGLTLVVAPETKEEGL